jgi:uncharacterized membrane protein YgdD (TMEM256/DUF423 family)
VLWTTWIAVGSVMAGLGVAFGAFGAHALRTRLDAEDLAIFEIGVRYQMYHALAIIACGLVALRIDNAAVKAAAICFIAGVVIFSGSLYGLTLSGQRWLGMVTPIGGFALLAGWASLAFAVLKPT